MKIQERQTYIHPEIVKMREKVRGESGERGETNIHRGRNGANDRERQWLREMRERVIRRERERKTEKID